MTGITDALHNARAAVGLGAAESPEKTCATIPRPFPGWQQRLALAPRVESSASALSQGYKTITALRAAACLWGLLLPVTSFGAGGQDKDNGGCINMLTSFKDSLLSTTTVDERSDISLCIAIDQGDPIYTEGKVRGCFSGCGLAGVAVIVLHPGYFGNVCTIWNLLAAHAVTEFKVDFLVLLGDDVVLQTAGWKGEIETAMRETSVGAGLPEGMACVAFRDLTMPAFPCFPVIHRRHVEIFGSVLPPEFINQGGDPFLFELYRRWGASTFADTAALKNLMGGKDSARYPKFGVRWQSEILTRELERFSRLAQPTGARCKCLGVVVPTHRCDVSMLQDIVSLKSTAYPDVSVQIIVVVDRPDAENLEEVIALTSYAKDHVVRVFVNEKNIGASESRNIGLSQAFSDHVVLLDDDVVPERYILDAYLGGIERYPDARVWVGCTEFPPAKTTVEHAVRASNLCHFYGIAKVVSQPPWGVTANLCVSGRSGDIWFNQAYPKTGGGEDVDFCLRIRQRYGPDAIVAVPGAVATHPYWNNPIRQMWGWARGDTLCLSFHPHSTFYRVWDWAETTMLIWVVGLVWFNVWKCLVASGIVWAVEYLEGLAHVYPGTTGVTPWAAVLLAPLPRMVQDAARLLTKLGRLNLYQLLLSFDWMDGTDGHAWRKASRALHATKFAMNVIIILGTALGYGMYCVLLGLAVLAVYWNWQTRRVKGKSVGQSGPARFVVLAWQRTGSNLLCGLLHNHSGVFMHNEIFHNRAIHTYHRDRLAEWGWTVARRDADREAFISTVFSQSDRPEQAIGFKLFPEHVYRDPETMASLLSDPAVKKIVLRRGNAVAAYVSQRRALLTGHFLRVKQPSQVSVHIDPDELQRHLTNYEACYATYSSLLAGQAFHEVLYEDLCGDTRETTFKGIADFLGLDAHVPLPLAQTARQTRASISNHEELARAFRFTVYKSDFGECMCERARVCACMCVPLHFCVGVVTKIVKTVSMYTQRSCNSVVPCLISVFRLAHKRHHPPLLRTLDVGLDVWCAGINTSMSQVLERIYHCCVEFLPTIGLSP